MGSDQSNVLAPASRISIAAVILVLISLLLPAAIVVWSARSAFAGKRFGAPSNEISYFPGALKNGEMWHWVRRTLNTWGPPQYNFRIKRLNLETGDDLETEIEVTSFPMNPIWLGDELYAYQKSVLYKLRGTQFVEFAQLPAPISGFTRTVPFLYQRKIATIVGDFQNGFQLSTLVDGEWTNIGTIRLPFSESLREDPTPFRVQRIGQAPAETDANPTDVPQDEQIRPTDLYGGGSVIMVTTDRDGLILLNRNTEDPQKRILRQNTDGTWRSLNGKIDQFSPVIVANPDEATAYLVDDGAPLFNAGNVQRIRGDTVHPVHLQFPGTAYEYLDRWKRLVDGLGLAWIIHASTLILGTIVLDRGSPHRFASGTNEVILASPSRRAAALCVDLLLILVIGFIAVRIQLPMHSPNLTGLNAVNLSETLFQLEQTSSAVFQLSAWGVIQSVSETIHWLFDFVAPIFSNRTFDLVLLAELSLVLVGKVAVEARYGFTPGKLLAGIRTLRTTLRPAGFARSLARNLLYAIDIPLMLTPLPGWLSMLLFPRRQRVGDRLADTIVIRAGTIHDTSSLAPEFTVVGVNL